MYISGEYTLYSTFNQKSVNWLKSAIITDLSEVHISHARALMHTCTFMHMHKDIHTRTVKYSCGIDNPQESSKGSQLAQA